jgi:hypothetical protein
VNVGIRAEYLCQSFDIHRVRVPVFPARLNLKLQLPDVVDRIVGPGSQRAAFTGASRNGLSGSSGVGSHNSRLQLSLFNHDRDNLIPMVNFVKKKVISIENIFISMRSNGVKPDIREYFLYEENYVFLRKTIDEFSLQR